MSVLSMKYSTKCTIETKEAVGIGYNGFLFPVKAEVRRITSFFLLSFELVNCKIKNLCTSVCFLLMIQVAGNCNYN